MSDSILRCKSKDFAKKIVFLCRDTKTKTKESVLTNQLLRSGTSIGANVYEAQYAQGKKDFISKLEIAQKECFETEYWLDLLFETGYIEESPLLVDELVDKTGLPYAQTVEALTELEILGHIQLEPNGKYSLT